jgi:hypothetical protein
MSTDASAEYAASSRGASAGAGGAAEGTGGAAVGGAAPGCERCGAPSAFFCARCSAARYCGRDCQRAAWPSHKLDCFAPETRARQQALSEQMQQLLGAFGDVPLDFGDGDGGAGSDGGGGGHSTPSEAARARAARELLQRLSPEYAEAVAAEGGGGGSGDSGVPQAPSREG